ncbi:MAG: DUF192 domain-containing protein [Firmicutes bacterium]|nr:DUF192 domain-containing protein [Bacillota bacterium]
MADQVWLARSFWTRFRGLMGYAPIDCAQGMLFNHTNAVHGFFMKFPLQCLYLSGSLPLLRVEAVYLLKPWHIGPVVRSAHWVLELSAQDCAPSVHIADTLLWTPYG